MVGENRKCCCGGPFIYAHASTAPVGLYKVNLDDGTRAQHPAVLSTSEFDIDAQKNSYGATRFTVFKHDSSGVEVWSTSLTAAFISILDVAVDENGRVCVVGTAGTSDDCIEFYDDDGTYIAGYQLSTVTATDVGNIATSVRARGDGHFLVGGFLSDTWDDSPGTGDSNKRNVWEFLGSDGSNTDSFVTGDPATEAVFGVNDVTVTDDGGFSCACAGAILGGVPSFLLVKFDSAGGYDFQIAGAVGIVLSTSVAADGSNSIFSINRGSNTLQRDKIRSYDNTGSLNWSVNLPSGWDNEAQSIGVSESLLLISSRNSNDTPRIYDTSGSFQEEVDDGTEVYFKIKPITVGSTP